MRSCQYSARFFIFLLFSLLTSYFVSAQADSTSAKFGNARSVYFNDSHSTKGTDTILDNLQNSLPRNTLGNVGLPSQQLITDIQDDKLGLRYYALPFKSDLFTANDPIYFQAAPIYTNLFASAGQKKEQVLKFTHAQLIDKKVNVSLKFNRYSALGFYQQQQSFVNNLMLSSNYKTKSGRWGYFAQLLYNKVKFQENGGITSDTLIKDNLFANKFLLPVRLPDAKNGFKTLDISFTQYFRLNRKSDSTQKVDHFIYYTAGYQSNYYQYTEGTAKSGFYDSTYYVNSADSIRTNDSTHLTKYTNDVRYLLKQKDERYMFYVGYKNEITNMYRRVWNPGFINDIAQVGGYLQNKRKTFKLSTEGEYIFHGDYQKDYRLRIDVIQKFKFKHAVFTATILGENRSPDQLYLWNETNHFYWLNKFNSVQTNQALVSFYLTDWKIKAQVCLKNTINPIYFDTSAIPRQLPGAVDIARFTLNKDLRIMKIHFNNTINYQVATDTTFVRIPKLITLHQLYYEGDLYKKNLRLQVGFQATYYSAFTGNAYMPATNVFYAQNKEKVGNYPYIDFFINAQIKPVKIFVKVEHINQGFMGANYMLTPTYIQPDRAIKFGFNWLFLD